VKTILLYRFTIIKDSGKYYQTNWQSESEWSFDPAYNSRDFDYKVVKTEVKEVMVEE
jgi:hypothetical protein